MRLRALLCRTLLKVMVDQASPPSTRVRAADSVLNHAAKTLRSKISKFAWLHWSSRRGLMNRSVDALGQVNSNLI